MPLALALWQGLTGTANGQPDYYTLTQDGITLCRKQFLIVTTFGAPAIGLLFGFLQILPELKRDRWAALLHRPISRGTLFASKAPAGVALYVFATVPAFVFIVWKVATPGNFGAPFLPAMIQPGLADLATGLLYYFAALTLSLQRGGWIGLRLFPLLAAIHVSYFVLRQPVFSRSDRGHRHHASRFAGSGLGCHSSPGSPGRPAMDHAGRLCRSDFLRRLRPGGSRPVLAQGPRADSPTKTMRYELSRDGFPLFSPM